MRASFAGVVGANGVVSMCCTQYVPMLRVNLNVHLPPLFLLPLLPPPPLPPPPLPPPMLPPLPLLLPPLLPPLPPLLLPFPFAAVAIAVDGVATVFECLDLGCHCLELCILGLCFIADVGSPFRGLFIGGNCCAGNFLDVLLDLVADICHLVGTLIAHISGDTATVLCVDFEVFDQAFEVQLCFVVITLYVDELVFPVYHFLFVETV